MTEIKDIRGKVLFSFDEMKTNLIFEIAKHKDLAGANLYHTNLIETNLDGANLVGANLIGANLAATSLVGANLVGANLIGANLAHSKLTDANLCYSNLTRASLVGASLDGTNLVGANLVGANLKDANLTDANLTDVYLKGAKHVPFLPMVCPIEGSFIAWKKVNSKYLIKLEIPTDAKRSSATTNKCRCDKAMVLEITNLVTDEIVSKVINNNYAKCVYKVGEMVYPDSFDDDRWNECSHGIHFFMNRVDAINY